jgi:hypothetical protein
LSHILAKLEYHPTWLCITGDTFAFNATYDAENNKIIIIIIKTSNKKEKRKKREVEVFFY